MTNESTIREPEKGELLSNSAPVRLLIKYGKEWGLFDVYGDKHNHAGAYKYPGAIKSLAFLIDQISGKEGAAGAEATLKEISKQITTTPSGSLNLFPLQKAINAKRKEKLAAEKEIAEAQGDAKLLSNVEIDQILLAAVEMDMEDKNTITAQADLDPVGESQLPNWALVILSGELSPDEIEAILDAKEGTTTVAGADSDIANQAAATNEGIVDALESK